MKNIRFTIVSLISVLALTTTFRAHSNEYSFQNNREVLYPKKYDILVSPRFGSDFGERRTTSLRGVEASVGRFWELNSSLSLKTSFVVSQLTAKQRPRLGTTNASDERDIRIWGGDLQGHLNGFSWRKPSTFFLGLGLGQGTSSLHRYQTTDKSFTEQTYRGLKTKFQRAEIGYSIQPSRTHAFFVSVVREQIDIKQSNGKSSVKLQIQDNPEGFNLNGQEYPEYWNAPSPTRTIHFWMLAFGVGIIL